VFCETFFSKDMPLTAEQKEALLKQMCELSSQISGSYIWVNLLYLDSGISLGTVDQINSRISFGNTSEYFIDSTGNDLMLPTFSGETKGYLYNTSFSIYGGKLQSRYDKATYQGENDKASKEGICYVPGEGKDIPLCELGSILINNISTEICFDLRNSIRLKNQWKNNDSPSNIHILQSNTISPYECWPSLPENELIIQADSQKNSITLETFLTKIGNMIIQRRGNIMIKSLKNKIDSSGFLYPTDTKDINTLVGNISAEKNSVTPVVDHGLTIDIEKIVGKVEIIPIAISSDSSYTIIETVA
jgi:hypothetical protein